MYPFEKIFLVIGEPVFDDPIKKYPNFGKDLEKVVAMQELEFGETGLFPPGVFKESEISGEYVHFEYRIYKGKSSRSEYEPIEFEYSRNESLMRVHSNIPEIKALPIVEFIAECYLGVVLTDEAKEPREVIVQCRSMDPCFKLFEMAARMMTDRIFACLENGEVDIDGKWWMQDGLELLTKRPKAADKNIKGPMRIGFTYPESVRVITIIRSFYEALYSWISECHPEQFDSYRRDYNSLAGQALDIFENLKTEEDWVDRFFTQAERPHGEKYNIYNPKPFECLYQVCLKRPKRFSIHKTFDDAEYLSACPVDEQGRLKVTLDGVTSEGEKALREAMKDKGGRPKGSKRDGSHLSQGDVAKMFGSPCDENKVSNWERFVRTGGKEGATPPSANVNGKCESYRAELRENYTGENCKILAAIIENFKSLHAVKTRLGTEKNVHARNDETLYRMQHPDGKVR